jgi:hypothetical protein
MFKTTLLALVLVVLGCGDNSGGGQDMSVQVQIPHNFDEINSFVFKPSCAAFSVCHSTSGASMAGNLNLQVDPYTALVGVLSNNAKAQSQGLLRVKPCDATNSFLIIKLTLPMNLDVNTDYGHYMPDTNPHLPAEQIQAIKDWISRGALRNEPSTVTGNMCTIGTHD